MVIGIIMMLKANAPARVEKRLMGTTTKAYANMPMTIEGTPFSRSVKYLTTKGNRVPPNSAR